MEQASIQTSSCRASLKPILILIFVTVLSVTGCGKSTTTYISMDREVDGSVSPADLIDVLTINTGQGAKKEVHVTFDPEWLRCKKDSAKTDFQPGMLVRVTPSVKDPLFLVDSFYSARALLAKTDLGEEYYKKFKMESGTILQITDGPYCYGKSIWWFVITRDRTAADQDSFLFGLVPEGENGVLFLELFEVDDK